jgi:tetratricopeptide (TPR) repeat protein
MIKCAKCLQEFTWEETYTCQNTPGSKPPPKSGRWGARVYCPNCGDLAVEEARPGDEWFSSRFTGKKEGWNWVGGNYGETLPQSPMFRWGRRIPAHLVPMFEETSLDIKAVKAYESEHAADKESAPQGTELVKQGYALLKQRGHEEQLRAVEKLFEQAYEAGLNRHDMACALGSLGMLWIYWMDDLATAEPYLMRCNELDPAAYWQSHYLLGLILEARGEKQKAQEAFKTARRAASPENIWWDKGMEESLKYRQEKYERNLKKKTSPREQFFNPR